MKLLLTIPLLFTFSYLGAKEVNVEQLFNVQTVKVQERSYAKSITSYGFVKPDDARIYDVSPRFGGFVEVLYADTIYQKVNKGEALAKVYSPEVLKAKDDYINTINFVRKNPNTTMLESAKTKLLLLDIPKEEIKELSNTLKSSSYTTLLSPADGYVFAKNLNNKGAFNAKNKLFKIVNLDKVWIETKIHQDQLSTLNSIKRYTITTPAYKKSFQAKRIQLYPKLDPKEESFTLRLEVANKEHLLMPGMYTTVSMSSAKKTYLTLPSTAVIRKNATFYVFIIGEFEGEYEPLEVQIEPLNANTYTILSGLEAGDEVVNNALFMMDSDAQINGLY